MDAALKGPQDLVFQDLSRCAESWLAVYSSLQSRIEIKLGQQMEWYFYITCPKELPGNSLWRTLLEKPIARAVAFESFTNLNWEVFCPCTQVSTLLLSHSKQVTGSWRSRLGLLDCKDEVVPLTIRVRSQALEFKALEGEFRLLQDCGTAANSLYKHDDTGLYLFLDAGALSHSDDDRFVFSYDCDKKSYGEPRGTLAYIDAGWRPWSDTGAFTSRINVTSSGFWRHVDLHVRPSKMNMTIKIPTHMSTLVRDEKACSRSVMILEVYCPQQVCMKSVKHCDLVLSRVKEKLPFSHWQALDDLEKNGCSCAPMYPRIMWHVNHKGMALPQEDRKAASTFERAIKHRPTIIDVRPLTSSSGVRIRVNLNITSLSHRAVAQLDIPGTVRASWRLVTDDVHIPLERLPQYQPLHNPESELCGPIPEAINYLSQSQWRSVTWMRKQERGQDIVVSEVEEATHPDLNWRAEARVEKTLTVRGGVLADLPSFGKTVTTIALIQDELYATRPYDDLETKRLGVESSDLLECPATLIVCPPHIVLQWQSELKKFLGDAPCTKPCVTVIDSFDELQNFSIADILRSGIIIVSWILFSEDAYISHMAHFAALPPPVMKGRRAFNTWLDRVREEVPRQLAQMREHKDDFQAFQKATEYCLAERLSDDEFKAYLPLRVGHGSSYQSFNAKKAVSMNTLRAKDVLAKQQLISSLGQGDQQIPLLHMMRFNRVVVDEYHYLNDESNAIVSVSMKNISAHKRWILSGTPALKSFMDVNELASHLGIRLGRFSASDGSSAKQLDKSMKNDLTLAEIFLAQTDTKSSHWHEARHQKAQEFHNLFVRQNPASLDHILCKEQLVSVESDIGHRAKYLELSQHLRSQRMQIKKLNNKMRNDKTDRLNASLDSSRTAEEALLKCALLSESANGESSLQSTLMIRSEQCRQTASDLLAEMIKFNVPENVSEVHERYMHFVNDVNELNWLGDSDATAWVHKLFIESCQPLNDKASLQSPDEKPTDEPTKQTVSNVRELARELVFRIRSERFLTTIQRFVQLLKNSTAYQHSCSAPDCEGKAFLADIRILTTCGHVTCDRCLSKRLNDNACIHPACGLVVQESSLLSVSDLKPNSNNNQSRGRSFGKKLDAITDIIKNFPDSDQGLVFAPNDEVLDILETVLDYHDISYHSLRRSRAPQAAKVIEQFKRATGLKKKTVLLLNLESETAAGV